MKKSTISTSESTEIVVRLSRLATDAVRKLDNAVSSASVVEDLFQPAIRELRMRLKDCCEKLMFIDPVNCGRKTEEMLWRKVHYDPYNKAKQIRKDDAWNAKEWAMLLDHLIAGVGNYQHLLFRLIHHFHLSTKGLVDFCPHQRVTEVSGKSKEKKGLDWAIQALPRGLICLGDLARYQADMGDVPSASTAWRYYHQAAFLDPTNGMPHNQLGTLAGLHNHGVSACFHYVLCLAMKAPFDGAEGNLRTLLQRKSRSVVTEGCQEESQLSQQFLDVLRMVILGADGWDEQLESQQLLIKTCHSTLQLLETYLQSPTPTGHRGMLVFELISMTVIACYKLHKKGSWSGSVMIAFFLATFSHLVSAMLARLEVSLPSLISNYRHDTTSAVFTNGTGNGARDKKNRRRRRLDSLEGGSSSDEHDSDVELTDDDDERDDLSESGEEEEVEDLELVVVLSSEELLPTIKLCTDWLRSNTSLLDSCAESSLSLWAHLTLLLNVIKVDAAAMGDADGLRPEIVNRMLNQPEELLANIPLPEDRELQGVVCLEKAQEELQWEPGRSPRLTLREEAVLRVLHLRRFGRLLSKLPQTGIKYSSEDDLFSHSRESPENKLKIIVENTPSTNTEVSSGDTKPEVQHDTILQLKKLENGRITRKVSTEPEKKQLMTNMAALWLKSEVKALEGKVRKHTHQFSPYLVLDSAVLISHLPFIKTLPRAKKFIIVVPTIVIGELDELKKDSVSARDAIRWLEGQFRRGNRFLRAQRHQERLPLDLVKYPKKKDKEAWHFFELMECCHYLSKQGGVHDRQTEAAAVVTLLTEEDSSTKGYSPRGLASTAGVSLEHVSDFRSKWRISSKGRS